MRDRLLKCMEIITFIGAISSTAERSLADGPPYPPSPVIAGITWHWETHQTAAPGSDLWPVTWGPDGHLYTAWGDGGGFGGTNSDARVSMGFARIEGPPESLLALNINGGKKAENPATFPKRGKTGGILFVDGTVYHSVLRRYLLTSFHSGPGQLGVFDAPQPWGPWTTVANYETWGEMGLEGHGLNCDFPQTWMSSDGRTMWCVFSVYGDGAKQGINAHDRFNLIKAGLTLRGDTP